MAVAAPPGVRVHVGTSGWSYAEWKGSFYPPGLPAARMLAWYAGRFPVVEADSTFYRVPRPETLARWAEAVPAGFRFAPKASRRITHDRRLRGAADSVRFFVDAVGTLGDRLGPVLFQLPPFLPRDDALLADFLLDLPPGLRAAFEFRHASWFDDGVFELLRRRGAALCVAQTDRLETPLVATAPWGYLRLRRTDYDEAALATWAARLRGGPWREAFVFLKHAERSPHLAARLAALLGEAAVAAPAAGAPAAGAPTPE